MFWKKHECTVPLNQCDKELFATEGIWQRQPWQSLWPYRLRSTMTDGICCESQAVMSPWNISPPASYRTPTVNKMHSRRGHTSRRLCFPHVSLKFPTRPIKLVSISVSSFVCVPSFPSFIFFHRFPLFCLSPHPPTAPLPSLLSTVEVNHHLYYTALQLINNMPGRKKNNPTLVVLSLYLSLSRSLSLSYSFFFPLSLQLNHKTSGPKTVNCLETQYGLHPGDYTVNSARLH